MSSNSELADFGKRVRRFILAEGGDSAEFERLALELFALQFQHNAAYRRICEMRGRRPESVSDWRGIPAAPTVAFKELELSSLPEAERTAVFYSSGTTEQRPSRHFHGVDSLTIYKASLWQWFRPHVPALTDFDLVMLTPSSTQAPHSSLVHMFEVFRKQSGLAESVFAGSAAADGGWTLKFDAIANALQSAGRNGKPMGILGTAFSFVQLLDELGNRGVEFKLPTGSWALETGGYKGRSRSLPKSELHGLITGQLGIPAGRILCEYGMSELSSQAYDLTIGKSNETVSRQRCFRFPHWTRVQIISPEAGEEVADGETGLIRIFDLANVYSVMAIQTEDLGVRRENGFELIGRSQAAEPRGCSLMPSDNRQPNTSER